MKREELGALLACVALFTVSVLGIKQGLEELHKTSYYHRHHADPCYIKDSKYLSYYNEIVVPQHPDVAAIRKDASGYFLDPKRKVGKPVHQCPEKWHDAQ